MRGVDYNRSPYPLPEGEGLRIPLRRLEFSEKETPASKGENTGVKLTPGLG
jgi:hypothetical protein